MVIVTTVTRNYLAHALQLVHSVDIVDPHACKVLCVVEPATYSLPAEIDEAYDYVCYASDLSIPNLEAFIFRHTIVEASTAIKARLLLFLMGIYEKEKIFVFLDPDVTLFSQLEEVIELAASRSIIVTPHLIGNENDPMVSGPFLFRMLNAGIYNTGFIAIIRTKESEAFLQWWDARLTSWCYFDLPRGLFVDQKWVDFAHGNFDLTVVRSPNYNVAHWNIRSRQIDRAGNHFECNHYPLRFIHFSGFRNRHSACYLLRDISRQNLIHGLAHDYLARLEECGVRKYAIQEWGYARFSSGERVGREAQIAYRESAELRSIFPNPFLLSNDEINTEYDQINERHCIEQLNRSKQLPAPVSGDIVIRD